MGELTRAEIRERVRFQFGNNTAFDSVGDDATNFYDKWIDAAYRRLTTSEYFWGKRRRFRFPELETSTTADTVDGTAYVSTPSGSLVIQHVYDTENNVYLTNIPYSEYVKYTNRADTSAEGGPTYWTRTGAYIYLHPTPDDAYTLRIHYRKIPDNFASDSATSEIGSEWDEIIVQLAVYTGKRDTGEFESAKLLKEDIDDMLGAMMSIYGQEEFSREQYIHVDPVYRRGSGY